MVYGNAEELAEIYSYKHISEVFELFRMAVVPSLLAEQSEQAGARLQSLYLTLRRAVVEHLAYTYTAREVGLLYEFALDSRLF